MKNGVPSAEHFFFETSAEHFAVNNGSLYCTIEALLNQVTAGVNTCNLKMDMILDVRFD